MSLGAFPSNCRIIIYVSVGIGVFVVTTIVVFSCLCCKGCPFYMRHKRSSPGIIFSSNTQPAIVTTQSPHSMPSPPPYYTHPGFVYQQQHNPYQEYQYQSLQQEQQQSIPYHTNLQQQDLLQQQYHQHQEVQNQQR
ncbi:TPR-containing protein DDB_G0280363-like isoform X2 [Periplaneta americana]|uniref:TPR-containing protein DDB_G0280363-like isoform X2 n=1 Tax=Periplaneta americana TaxID=6978 RepID=UPI0037E8C6A1